MKTALLIMAAGIGSRFKKGLKQLTQVGPSGETLLEYSIYDAIEAGFDKLVFVIREELQQEFEEQLGKKLDGKIEVAYAYQKLSDLPEGYSINSERTKPLGTGQAVLSARNVIDCPFAVINADDFYGRQGFKILHDYLVSEVKDNDHKICMVGYKLGNTLSDNGSVTRGICQVDSNSMLTDVNETMDIVRSGDGAVGKTAEGKEIKLAIDAAASMNMWGFAPGFMKKLDSGFKAFLDEKSQDLKAEYLLPEMVNSLIQKKEAEVKVLSTDAKWYGMTYSEDTEAVRSALKKMTEEGKYPERLF